jgi:hypothetical protein
MSDEELENTERARILKVIRDEIRMPRIAEVEEVYTHTSADDTSNHEADLSIPPGPHEIRSHDRVPIAVPTSGALAVPQPNDLVLVEYLAGDGDAPIITQVVYGDAPDDRAPIGDVGDVQFSRGDLSVKVAGDGSFARLASGAGDGSPDLVVELDDSGRVVLGNPDGDLQPVARQGDAVEDGSGNQIGTIVDGSADVESS